ncbi:hypothetical protein HPY42_01115 [Coprothermobacteraceae bacterium]|nr:hypothetical protein [Coprothermobacteraceae bacterium]
MEDLDLLDLAKIDEYTQEWAKVKKPIWRRIGTYYLLHDTALKGVFVGTAGLAIILQYTPYGYLLTFPQWLVKFITSMLLPAFSL